MKENPDQIEFCDIHRDRTRPAGSGLVIDGAFVFNTHSQRPDQVAYTLGCTGEHIYHLIQEGEFANARDISSTNASKACYRIPRQDVIDFLETRKEVAK